MGPTKNYDWHKKVEKEMEKNKTPDEQIRKGSISVLLIDKLEDNKESPECLSVVGRHGREATEEQEREVFCLFKLCACVSLK